MRLNNAGTEGNWKCKLVGLENYWSHHQIVMFDTDEKWKIRIEWEIKGGKKAKERGRK